MTTFACDQLKAAKLFAQTMIVVDDASHLQDLNKQAITPAITPGRKKSIPISENQDQGQPLTHPLDAQQLVDSSLEKGLVCSVVRPKDGDENIAEKIAKAARRADIMSIDWQMGDGNDQGSLACEIINQIITDDMRHGGRFRLISIYTGDPNHKKIRTKIMNKLNEKAPSDLKFQQDDDTISSNHGLRLVVISKQETGIINGVSVMDLPDKLLGEFSKLSAGLLSNVALATIADIRSATHRVITKFEPSLDASYFHHQALLTEPSHASDYAVGLVLSEIKGRITSSSNSKMFTSKDAVLNRLKNIQGKSSDFKFAFLAKKDKIETRKLSLQDVFKLLDVGLDNTLKELRYLKDQVQSKEISTIPDDFAAFDKIPGKNTLKKYFATIFCDGTFPSEGDRINAANEINAKFTFMTTTKCSERSFFPDDNAMPRLDLGSVIYSEDRGYLLCLQATCDTSRGDGNFFFVPLVECSESPEDVVPHGKTDDPNCLKLLALSKAGYTKSTVLDFGKIDTSIGRVPVKRGKLQNQYVVTDIHGISYRWLCNLKYKRALKVAQAVSHNISRVGFDEFEPFRK